jgi:hypothetical protein
MSDRFWWWRYLSWPIGRCVQCGRRFLRRWPWQLWNELCSERCIDIHLERELGPPNAGGRWESHVDVTNEPPVVRIRWSRPNESDGSYFYVRTYPLTDAGAWQCAQQIAEWNREWVQPWHLIEWADREKTHARDPTE